MSWLRCRASLCTVNGSSLGSGSAVTAADGIHLGASRTKSTWGLCHGLWGYLQLLGTLCLAQSQEMDGKVLSILSSSRKGHKLALPWASPGPSPTLWPAQVTAHWDVLATAYVTVDFPGRGSFPCSAREQKVMLPGFCPCTQHGGPEGTQLPLAKEACSSPGPTAPLLPWPSWGGPWCL